MLFARYIEVLSGLQDNVPGFDSNEAMAIIEREFNTPIEDLYDSFDPTPLAAASLGQVSEAHDVGVLVWVVAT